MRDVFFWFSMFAFGSIAFVSIQAVAIVFLVKWNRELRERVEYLEPPF